MSKSKKTPVYRIQNMADVQKLRQETGYRLGIASGIAASISILREAGYHSAADLLAGKKIKAAKQVNSPPKRNENISRL